MLSSSKVLSFLLFTSFVAAVPHAKRASCGQWDTIAAGDYTIYLDQWGLANAESGEACATLTSDSGSTIGWVNNWTWTGGTGVKSYTSAGLNVGIGAQLSAISTMPTTWKWSQTTSGTIVADIAYDLFTSSSATGSNEYEIMIWMANYNAGPISYTYSASGSPTPLVSGVSLAGYTWDLYYGSNGSNYVYSFLLSSGSVINSFSADLKTFLSYLTTSQGLSTSQYLITAQGGSEATSGTADLTVSEYSLVIN